MKTVCSPRRAFGLTPIMACLIAGAAAGLAPAHASPYVCGNPFVNHFGPIDFRKSGKAVREMVEKVHFTPGIETMTRPGTTMLHDMAADVAYTLEVFPNHHRALLTMQRLSERHKVDPAPGGRLIVECWYKRAAQYTPDDTVVRALYAQYLGKLGRKAEAAGQLRQAAEHAKDNPLSHYNIGLVAFEIGDPDLALKQAHRALELGFTQTGLADRLRQANRWADPVAAAAAGAAPGSAPN